MADLNQTFAALREALKQAEQIAEAVKASPAFSSPAPNAAAAEPAPPTSTPAPEPEDEKHSASCGCDARPEPVYRSYDCCGPQSSDADEFLAFLIFCFLIGVLIAACVRLLILKVHAHFLRVCDARTAPLYFQAADQKKELHSLENRVKALEQSKPVPAEPVPAPIPAAEPVQ